MIQLKVGQKFTSKWFEGITKILAINTDDNKLDVEIYRASGHNHSEEWNLEHTLIGFERGEYFFMKPLNKLEYFFYEEKFCSEIDDLLNELEIDEESINELEEDWTVRVELSDLEPIFKIDANNLCQLLADANEDRLTENFDEEAAVLKALNECIDFDKLKQALPNLYYPNNTFKTITKADLLEWIK